MTAQVPIFEPTLPLMHEENATLIERYLLSLPISLLSPIKDSGKMMPRSRRLVAEIVSLEIEKYGHLVFNAD